MQGQGLCWSAGLKKFLWNKKIRTMPVNNFEKLVQQKMDELQLRPSAEVWEEVEKRIRKEKRRRRFILWFFLFGALSLSGAAWWVIDNNKKQIPADNSVTQTITDRKTDAITTNTSETINKENASKNKTEVNSENENEKTAAPSTSNPAITKTETSSDKEITVVAEIKKPVKKEKIITNPAAVVLKKKNRYKTKTSLPSVTNNDQPAITKKKDKNEIANKPDDIVKTDGNAVIKEPVVANKNSEANDTLAADKNILANDQVSSKQETTPQVKDSLVTKQPEPVTKKSNSKPKKNKWEFGIMAMAGSSTKTEGISIFDGQKSFDALTLGSSPVGSPAQTVTTVALPKKSFSWQIGMYAKRKLTKRTGLSAGFIFFSYSTIQQTGSFVDSSRVYYNNRYSSSVSNFYRNGTAVDYKNHYYCLQLPVSFHWQLNKGVKLPLVWQNGFSVGFLTGSNALVYNSASNVFYRDNKLLYKTQIAYQSGLYVKLFNKSKNPLTAGVLYNYHFSKLEKVNLSGSNHLSSFGVQLGWLLPLSPKGRLSSTSQYNN
jgi:hypothetical protein